MATPSTVSVTVDLPVAAVQAIRAAVSAGNGPEAIAHLTAVGVPALFGAVVVLPSTLDGVLPAHDNELDDLVDALTRPRPKRIRKIADATEDITTSAKRVKPEPITIIAKTLVGARVGVATTSDTTIDCIKDKIFDLEGIPPADQRIIFGGQQCESGRTLGQVSTAWQKVCNDR